jgi:hypothetical protein
MLKYIATAGRADQVNERRRSHADFRWKHAFVASSAMRNGVEGCWRGKHREVRGSLALRGLERLKNEELGYAPTHTMNGVMRRVTLSSIPDV